MAETTTAHRRLIIVVVIAAVVVLLALASAFVWPGWALNKQADDAGNTSAQTPDASPEATEPTVSPKNLPDDATELLKAMPDSVLNFARVEAAPSASWTANAPLEEYTLSYQTGDDKDTITLIVAQWTTADGAKKQFDEIANSLKGEELASGNVKVSGDTTGSYLVRQDEQDENKAIGLWQNGTAVFEATGSKDSVQRFYQAFPL